MFQLILIILCFSLIKCSTEIREVIACEETQLNLECLPGEVISIKYANYGRTESIICKDLYTYNRNCYSNTSLSIVKDICNNKQKCTISATNSVFGDPCIRTLKYLKVQYQCVTFNYDYNLAEPCEDNQFQCNNGLYICASKVNDGFKDCLAGEDEQEHDYSSVYACEGNDLRIYCKKDEVISIINANYGRLSSKICTDEYMCNQNCKSLQSLNIVTNRCNQKGYCIIPSTNNVFGDPCPGTYKYTEVHYKCVQKPNCTQNEFQCNHGQCIDISKKCDGFLDCEDGEDEKGCNYLTEIACENSNLKIECKKDHIINIVGANYGRQEQFICSKEVDRNCLTSTSKKIVTERCNGLRTCNIVANNNLFGDSCSGIIKYLSVNYKCVNKYINMISPVV